MTYISWFSGLYLEDYFMYKAVTLAGGIREPLLTCSSLEYIVLLLFYLPQLYVWNKKNAIMIIIKVNKRESELSQTRKATNF